MNIRDTKLHSVTLYTGFVFTSLLGILIGISIWIYQERKFGLEQFNSNHPSIRAYIENSYRNNQEFNLEKILAQFPMIHYISVRDHTQTVLFQAIHDKNSFWLNLPQNYTPKIWELSYYTQKIHTFSLSNSQQANSLHVLIVVDLLSQHSITIMTLITLIGVLILFIITLIVSLVSNVKPKKQPVSYPLSNSTSAPDPVYQHDSPLSEMDSINIQPQWTEDEPIYSDEEQTSLDYFHSLSKDEENESDLKVLPEENYTPLNENFFEEEETEKDFNLDLFTGNTLEENNLSLNSDILAENLNHIDTSFDSLIPEDTPELLLAKLEEPSVIKEKNLTNTSDKLEEIQDNSIEEISQEQLLDHLYQDLKVHQHIGVIALQETSSSQLFPSILKDFVKNYFNLNFLVKMENIYILTVLDKTLEDNYTLLSDLNQLLQKENLHFSAGLSSKESRDVPAKILWNESRQALDRALASDDIDALIAFKTHQNKLSIFMQSSD